MDGKELSIDLRLNNGSIMWGTNATFHLRSLGWWELPKASDGCGAYINGTVNMIDCQKPTFILCEEE
jgi:hypothetical protein